MSLSEDGELVWGGERNFGKNFQERKRRSGRRTLMVGARGEEKVPRDV